MFLAAKCDDGFFRRLFSAPTRYFQPPASYYFVSITIMSLTDIPTSVNDNVTVSGAAIKV